MVAFGVWCLWYPRTDVLTSQGSHLDSVSWIQLAFLGSCLFFEPCSLAFPSIMWALILSESSLVSMLARKNLTGTILYSRNQTKATNIFHHVMAAASGLLLLLFLCLKCFVHTYSRDFFSLTSSGLCPNLTCVDLIKEAFSHHPI